MIFPSSSQSYPPKAFRFTNEINATSKIALEHLLALFHLGILESVDPFFVDSGIARLHKALALHISVHPVDTGCTETTK